MSEMSDIRIFLCAIGRNLHEVLVECSDAELYELNVPFKSMESWNLRRDSDGYRRNCHKVKTERHTINERYF